MLIDQGASVNEKAADSSTPLHVVCQEGHDDTALKLILRPGQSTGPV